MAARFRQHTGRGPGFVLQFKLAGVGQAGTDGHGHVFFFCQLVHDEVALGDVFQRDAQAELMGNAQRGEDIVCLVGVGFQGDLPCQHRQQSLELLVIGGHLGHIAVCGLLACAVVLGLHQRTAQERRRGHTGRVALVTVAALGVLTEGAFHGNRVFDDHVIDAVADGFHG